jgi:hypothetical protein
MGYEDSLYKSDTFHRKEVLGMEWYLCYEDKKRKYEEAYATERYALEYAEEAKERGYFNVRVERRKSE